jgi:hypothetical protein
MYGEDFWERVNLQQMREFFQNGTEKTEIETGNFEARYKTYTKAFTEGLHKYRDLVLATDWESIKDDEARKMKGEDLFSQTLEYQGELEDLSFEVGMVVGFRLCLQMAEGQGWI